MSISSLTVSASIQDGLSSQLHHFSRGGAGSRWNFIHHDRRVWAVDVVPPSRIVDFISATSCTAISRPSGAINSPYLPRWTFGHTLTLLWHWVTIHSLITYTNVYNAYKLNLPDHSHDKYHYYSRRKKVKERIVLREIHLRTTRCHLSNGITQCYPTEVAAPPSPQPGRLVLDLSTP